MKQLHIYLLAHPKLPLVSVWWVRDSQRPLIFYFGVN